MGHPAPREPRPVVDPRAGTLARVVLVAVRLVVVAASIPLVVTGHVAALLFASAVLIGGRIAEGLIPERRASGVKRWLDEDEELVADLHERFMRDELGTGAEAQERLAALVEERLRSGVRPRKPPPPRKPPTKNRAPFAALCSEAWKQGERARLSPVRYVESKNSHGEPSPANPDCEPMFPLPDMGDEPY